MTWDGEVPGVDRNSHDVGHDKGGNLASTPKAVRREHGPYSPVAMNASCLPIPARSA